VKYFHRTSVSPDAVMAQAVAFFSGRLTPAEEQSRRRRYSGILGDLSVTVQAEGGHYTLVTVETNQPGESELDRLAKRFLGVVHQTAEPDHVLRGTY
jgi:DNA-binding transcriptional ArsR family regulator